MTKKFCCVFCKDGTFLVATMFKKHIETIHNMFYEYDILFAINFIGEVEKDSILKKVSTSNSAKPGSKYEEEMKSIESPTYVLKDHDDSLNVVKRHSCNVCSKAFKHRRDLRHHVYTHTKEKPHTCTYCDRSFAQTSHLKTHTKKHTGEKPYTCLECYETFSMLHSLKSHSYTHGGERPHKCKQCDKIFAQYGNLKKHILIHTGKKSFNCHQCSKAFYNPYDVKKHMVVHTGVKPYQCQNCSDSFSNKSNLKVHSQKHSGLIYACQQCDKTFTDKGIFKKHTDHHIFKEYIERSKISVPVGGDLISTVNSLSECKNGIWTCTACGKTATTRRNNKSHMTDHAETHIRGLVYNCQACGKFSKTSAGLRYHHKKCKKVSIQNEIDTED